jgi:hypothetical protein
MNISLNASGKEHVEDLINMMKNAGMKGAEEVSTAMMPMRTDMERLRGIVDGPKMALTAPNGESIDEGENNYPHLTNFEELYGIQDEELYKNMADDAQSMDIEEFEDTYSNVIDMASDFWEDHQADVEEGYDNEPDEQYDDHETMIHDLSGGINRKKKAYKAAQDGDNAIAVESIKDQLYAMLSEKKAKPDFLDIDKDGDTKEPMKKAAKEAGKGKGSKPKKGEVPPQFKKK